MKTENTLYHAALNISLAAKRLRFFCAHRMTAENQAAISEFWAENATAEQCREKLAAIESYLAAHEDIARRFDTVQDGSGCTGRSFIERAAMILSNITQ